MGNRITGKESEEGEESEASERCEMNSRQSQVLLETALVIHYCVVDGTISLYSQTQRTHMQR